MVLIKRNPARRLFGDFPTATSRPDRMRLDDEGCVPEQETESERRRQEAVEINAYIRKRAEELRFRKEAEAKANAELDAALKLREAARPLAHDDYIWRMEAFGQACPWAYKRVASCIYDLRLIRSETERACQRIEEEFSRWEAALDLKEANADAAEAAREARAAWKASCWLHSGSSPVFVAAFVAARAARAALIAARAAGGQQKSADAVQEASVVAAKAAPRVVVQARQVDLRAAPLAIARTGQHIDWNAPYFMTKAQYKAARPAVTTPKFRRRLTPMAERARRVGVELRKVPEEVIDAINNGSPGAQGEGKRALKRVQIANHQLVTRAEESAARRRLY